MKGSDLRSLRRAAGINQAVLAAHLGVTQQRVSAMERKGASDEVANRVLRAIAELASRRAA